MILRELILDNFLTYSHLEYKFEKRPLLVQGLNLTDENQKSNGTGKSGMQTAIEFCITASNSRDVRDLELVMYGHTEARAQLIASCDVRKESIHIDWIIKVKGSNKLTLTKKTGDSDWEEVSFSNTNDGKKWIMNWFDISREDLFNYFIINKSRFKSFFKSSNKEKVDLINRFSDASIIEGLDEVDNEELEQQKNLHEVNVNKVDGQIELVDEKILKEKQRDFKAEFEEESDDIKAEIKAEKDNIVDYEDEIEEIKKNKKENSTKIKTRKDLLPHYDETEKGINIKIDAKDNALVQLKANLSSACEDIEKFDEECEDWDEKHDSLNKVSDELSKKLETKEDEAEKLEAKKTKILSFLQGIEVKLSGSIECPKCEHEFILDGDIDKLQTDKQKGKELEEKIEEIIELSTQAIKKLEEKVKKISSKISQLNKEEREELDDRNVLSEVYDEIRDKVQSKKDEIEDLKKELRENDKNRTHIENEITSLGMMNDGLDLKIKSKKEDIKNSNTEIISLNKELETLKPGNNKDAINAFKKEIKGLEALKSKHSLKLSEVNDEIYLRNQWKINFKQFRGFLANQSLEVIGYHCNRYLKDMGSDLRIQFEGFKAKADGSLKDEITAKILRNGIERSYSSYSGGERGRLLFASILANRHMINKTHKYGGLDFLSIDEIFEGVDGVGLKHLIHSAKQLDITAMIITHVTDEEASGDVLTIVKENGISTIKKNG